MKRYDCDGIPQNDFLAHYPWAATGESEQQWRERRAQEDLQQAEEEA